MVADSASTLAMVRVDSARAAAAIYTLVLLSTVPLAGAAVASVALRHASAGARVLVWRSAVIALLMLAVGRAVPLHGLAWAVPQVLATPLVALGRIQVTAGVLAPLTSVAGSADLIDATTHDGWLAQLVMLGYLAGVMMVLIPTIVASISMRRAVCNAARVDIERWRIDALCREAGVRRRLHVYLSTTAVVPMTWGWITPVVVLPSIAAGWTDDKRRIVLLHELTHVRAADWVFNISARAACALFWFHPGLWLLARTLRADCELARDDDVIAAGVRRSDYAELLVNAADALRGPAMPPSDALALSQRSGLRARLSAVLDGQHEPRPLARGWAVAAALATISVAGPMSVVQLAPTRDVLTTLMSDTRWDARAYAVMGLAQRADSIAVARSAAERDPSPRVRAWARYALGESGRPPVELTVDRPQSF